jgi:hypothetical protein
MSTVEQRRLATSSTMENKARAPKSRGKKYLF